MSSPSYSEGSSSIINAITLNTEYFRNNAIVALPELGCNAMRFLQAGSFEFKDLFNSFMSSTRCDVFMIDKLLLIRRCLMIHLKHGSKFAQNLPFGIHTSIVLRI